MTYQACLLLEEGKSMDEIVSVLTAMTEDYFVLISVDSLEYLRKGGRLGKAAALMGSILNIKPLIGLHDGELMPYSKVRGKKNALADIVKGMNKHAGDNKDDYTAIAFTTCMNEERSQIADELKNSGFKTVHQWTLGNVVGAHVGPTGFAAVILKKYPGQKIF
jgi:DegV family protein with EDD domain